MVPAATSADADKVLTVDAQGAPAWAAAQSVTVDQSYSASSPNAQSGTAVAQAIAAIPPTSYTAGNGIAISSSKAISAVGGDGITVTGPSTSSVNLYAPTRGTSVSMLAPLTADLVSMIETGGLNVVPSIDLTVSVEPTVGLYVSICTIGNYNLIDTSQRLVLGQVNLSVTHTQEPDPEDPEFLEDYYTAASNGATLVYDIDDLNSTLSNTLTWADVKASPSNYAIVLLFFSTERSCKVGSYNTGSSSAAFNTGVYTTVTPGAITVTNPLPASTVSDATKVLTVNSSGAAVWATPTTVTVDQSYSASSTNAQSGTAVAQAIAAIPSSSYTAGEGIAITNDTLSVDHDSTLKASSASVTLTPTFTGATTVTTQQGTVSIQRQIRLYVGSNSGIDNNSVLSLEITPVSVQGSLSLPVYDVQPVGTGTIRLVVQSVEYPQQKLLGMSAIGTLVSASSSTAQQYFGYSYEVTSQMTVHDTFANLFDIPSGVSIAEYIDANGYITLGIAYYDDGNIWNVDASAAFTGSTGDERGLTLQ